MGFKRKFIAKSLNITGNSIKYYRNQKKVSLEQLSSKLMLLGIDLHRQSLYNIEHGIRTVTDYELLAIAICLDIPFASLYQDAYTYFNFNSDIIFKNPERS